MSDSPLDGKVALITGASRGVGKAIALELAQLGADIAITARSDVSRPHLPGTIGETAAGVERLGRRALAVKADLLNPFDVEHLIAQTLHTFSRVDILVNNAANTEEPLFEGFWDTSPDSWDQLAQLNLNVPYRLMKAFAPAMRADGDGLIVNIGSAGSLPPPGIQGSTWQGVRVATSYFTTKLALLAMSMYTAQEVADDHIAVVTLNPGSAATEVNKWHCERFGLDFGVATAVAYPAKAVGYIACSDDPMVYSGTYIEAVPFSRELGLVTE
jgi:NAD(P)-dependent dehydrogenase (short-subunit alcohol dehydrogenase family)